MKFVIYLTFAFLLSGQIFAEQDRHDSKRKRERKILNELNLTDKQLAEIKTFMKAQKEKRKDISGDRRSKRDEMKKLFIDGKPDSDFINLHKKISKNKEKRSELRLEKMIFFKNLLTPEQRKIYIEKKSEGKHRRGRH